MKWLKMGCGHLVALPLLFIALIAGIGYTSHFGESSLSVGKVMVAVGVVVVTGGLGSGILYHLWTNVWPASESGGERRAKEGRTGVAAPSDAPTDPASAQDADNRAPVSFRDADDSTGKPHDAGSPTGPDRAEGPSSGEDRHNAGSPAGADRADDASSAEGAERTSNDDESELSRLPDDERPWEVRDEWTDPEISSEQSPQGASSGTWKRLLISRLLAIVGGGIAWLGFYRMDPSDSWIGPVIIGTIFVIAGIGVMARGVYLLLRHRRFGETTFEMDTFPGILGGPLCGTLHTGVRAADAPDGGVRVKLSCYRRQVSGAAETRSVSRHTIWRDEKLVDPRRAADGEMLDVPVAFEIPSEPPPSTPARTEERIMWRIEASASLPGVDYASDVEVPVFPVKPDDSVSLDRYTRHEIGHDEDAPLSDGITLRRPAPDRLQLTFGRARRPGSATLLTVLGLGFTGGAVFTIGAGGIILGLILLLLAVLTSWGAYFYWTYRSEVDVGPQGIEVRAGAPGFKKTTRIPCESFNEVRLIPNAGYTMWLSHSGNGVVTKGGERMKRILQGIGVYGPLQRMAPTEHEGVVAARMLTDHQKAERLASQIEKAAARVR